MDLRQLRYFVEIVDSGSLSKASRQLLIAQPALTQQLAKLEDYVGKPLLHRSSKGVSPTDNGLALYHHARFMLRQFDQTLSIARSDAGAIQGMVSLGMPATTVAAIALPLVRKIRANYPSILLNVVEGMSGHIGHMLRHGELDLAVLFSNDVAPDLTVEPLLEEELFIIIPEHSKLVPQRRKSITIAEAAEIPLILPTGSHGLRKRIAAEFENRGLTTNVVAEIDSLSLVMNSVYADMGATIKPMGAVMQDAASQRKWRCLSISDGRFRRRNYLYSPPPARYSAAMAAVAKEIKIAAHDLVAGGKWSGFEYIASQPAVADAAD